ncbi:MAG: shikimate kinase, partial [Myxococcales bacterium]
RFLEQHPRAVIATGGGIVQSPEAFALLDSRCVTVWLRARPDEHWERVIQQGDVRPMKGRKQAREELERLLASREPLYARAHHTLDTSTLGVAGSVEKLRELTANG